MDRAGFEPATSALRRQRSSPDLPALDFIFKEIKKLF